jgi:hypothetical protein
MSFPTRLLMSISNALQSHYDDDRVYLDTFEYKEDDEYETPDEEDDYDGRSNCSEVLAGEEAEADEQQDEFREQKINKHDDYIQVMQLVVEFIKSTLTPSGFGVITIEKSTKAGELYIYMPITGNVYTLKHDPSRTLKSLLYYILHITPEFLEHVKGKEFNFILDAYESAEKGLFYEPQDDGAMTADDFLSMPLDEMPLMQGTITLKDDICKE